MIFFRFFEGFKIIFPIIESVNTWRNPYEIAMYGYKMGQTHMLKYIIENKTPKYHVWVFKKVSWSLQRTKMEIYKW